METQDVGLLLVACIGGEGERHTANVLKYIRIYMYLFLLYPSLSVH